MPTSSQNPGSNSIGQRPNPAPSGPRPSSPAQVTSGSGFAPIDPLKLLRQYYPILILALVVGAGVGTAGHFLLLWTRPTFQSTVRYEATGIVNALGQAQTPAKDEFARFMGTQVAMLKSPGILGVVVNDPEVRKTIWAKAFEDSEGYHPNDAVDDLLGSLNVKVVTDTSYVDVIMSTSNKNDCKIIVDAVHSAYMSRLRDQGNSVTSESRGVLTDRLGELDTLIENKRKLRDKILDDKDIDSMIDAQNAASILVEDLQQNIVDVTQALASQRTQLGKHTADLEAGIYSDQIRADVQGTPLVQQLNSRLTEQKATEQALRERGFGDNHPEVVAINRQILSLEREKDAQTNTMLRDRLNAVIDVIRTKVKQLEMQDADLSQQLATASLRREDLVRSLKSVKEYEAQIRRHEEDKDKVQGQLDNIMYAAQYSSANRIRTIQTGSVPVSPVFPKLYIMIPAGALLIPALVGGLLVLRELLEQRVRGPADVALIPRVRVLGLIPDSSEDPAKPALVETAFRDSPSGAITESIRQIRAAITKKMDLAGHKSILVLAGMPQSGATSVALNIAFACAAADEKVLLIDANMRRPAVHRLLGLQESPGLGGVLGGESTLDSCIQRTPVPNLEILTAGVSASRIAPERLGTESMSKLLAEARSKYDRIIIDSAPAIVSSDGLSLAGRCDAVALVVRALGEKRGLVSRLANQLLDTQADMLGVIVNGVRSSAGGYFRGNIQATHEYQKSAA